MLAFVPCATTINRAKDKVQLLQLNELQLRFQQTDRANTFTLGQLMTDGSESAQKDNNTTIRFQGLTQGLDINSINVAFIRVHSKKGEASAKEENAALLNAALSF